MGSDGAMAGGWGVPPEKKKTKKPKEENNLVFGVWGGIGKR